MDVREETMLNGGSRTDRAIIEQLYKTGAGGGGGGTGGVAGVRSFNGRSGNVTPKEGDYTAEQVGALPIEGGTLLGSLAVGENAIASGEASFAQGGNAVDGDTRTPTEASGLGSHAEGFGSKASETASHAEGFMSKASANYSHAEGRGTMASGTASHAEGGPAADEDVSVDTIASGNHSHAEGSGTTAEGLTSHAEGFLTKALYSYAHAEGRRSVSSGNSSHAEGYLTVASGNYSHAEGRETTASGSASHAEGSRDGTDGVYTLTEASGNASHAEGCGTKAEGLGSHSEGGLTVASGLCSHAEGTQTRALGYRSHAANYSTIAHSYETAIGRFNVDSGLADTNTIYSNTGLFIVGNGSSSGRSNIFRVTTNAIFGSATFNSSGADYAEMFEWEDGNPNGEDRVGRFVTLNGSKIRIATGSDDFILGIVSATPSVVGDNHSDQWKGMHERDIFGRIIFDKGNMNDISEDEETFERIERINPAYNNTERYVARSDRPEWSAIGLLGKLIVIDDGTCQVNGWCRPTLGGLATESSERTKYRVMERLDDSHVLILIL